MAELRALVAVKRVIDFAVKVTFPTPTRSQHPETAAMNVQEQERAPHKRTFQKSISIAL
jgi:hypothetical protein